jgi:hypothetical protein
MLSQLRFRTLVVSIVLQACCCQSSTSSEYIFQNTAQVSTPAPSVKSVVARADTKGTTLVITGAGFGDTQGSSKLTLNGEPSTPQSWSAKEIKVAIPSGTPLTQKTIVVTVDGIPSNPYAFKSSQDTKSSCTTGPLELEILSPNDSVGVAALLSSIFRDVKVEAGIDSSKKPNGTLCVKARTTQQYINKCVRDIPNSTAATYCDIEKIVRMVDIDEFKGSKLTSNYFIYLPNLDNIPDAQHSVAKSLKEFFPHPAPNLEIRDMSAGYSLLIPSPGSSDQTANSKAGQLKRDFERMDQLYSDAASDVSLRESLLCGVKCGDSTTASVVAEKWLAKHTARFAILSPRDVALALEGIPGWTFQVRSFGEAVTILPNSAVNIASAPAYLTADEVERDTLYHERLQEYNAPTGKNSDQGTKPTPPATTTQSATTVEMLSGNKSTPPLTTKVTTTTTTNSAGSQKQESTDAASQKQSGNSATTEDQKPTPALNTSDSSVGKTGNDPSQSKSKNIGAVDSQDSSSTSTSLQQPLRLDNVVRLFHLRQADKIADAINKAASSKDKPLVQAVDDDGNNDLILILPSPPGGFDQTTSIRRAIAMFDLPRPQLSLQVWSYQMTAGKTDRDRSSKNPAMDVLPMEKAALALSNGVQEANQSMMTALEVGFGTLMDLAAQQDFFDDQFRNYLTKKFYECLPDNSYCLGYFDALNVPATGFKATNASLNRLLLYLSSSRETKARLTAIKVICAMNHPSPAYTCSIPENSSAATTCSALASNSELAFSNFCSQLLELAAPRNLRIFKAALIDFLFQYKWTYEYLDDFVPYDLQRSAHVVDSLFGPIVDAFNRDLDKYVSDKLATIATEIRKSSPKESLGLLSRGNVQVSTVSGSQAYVDGKVNNYFDITPPISLNDILNTGNQPNIASNLKNILEPKEILILQSLANIGSRPRIEAQVTKEAKLTITPTTLDEASSAQLDVQFDVSEPDSPETVNQKTAQKDLLDRVAAQNVKTRVRVESLKLFQVSAFTMELTHPQEGKPLPIIGWGWQGVFGSTPGLDRVFRFPPSAKTEDNRSFAIVRAVVVPTAMDLGLSLRFESDRMKDPITAATDPLNSIKQAGGKLRPFHKCYVQQLLNVKDPCKLKLSETLEDLRDPATP